MFNRKGTDKRAPEKRASERDRHRESDRNRGSGTKGSTSERNRDSDRNDRHHESSRRERNDSSPSRRKTSGRSTHGSLGIESQMERLTLTDNSRISLKHYKGKKPAQKLTQIARSHTPKKMGIQMSSPRRTRKLATSYMSGSNPQRIVPALPTQSQGVQFLAIEMYGVRLHMMANIRFNIPSSTGAAQAEGPGVVDTGTRFILADRSQFDPSQLAQYEVDNQGQPVTMNLSHPGSGATLGGVLHQSGVTVGFARTISLQAQTFYVTRDPTQQLEQRIIGIGPIDSPYYIPGESISYRACPSLLETVKAEYNLGLVLGIYVGLWNEDPNEPTIAYGLVHFGGVDASLYVGEPRWVERAHDPSVANHYGVHTTMKYGGQNIRGEQRRLAILDTGAPGIHLTQRIFDDWIGMLRAAGVDVIDPQNAHNPWLIPEQQIEDMRDLTLHFTDVTDQEFRVRIPVDRLLYPSKVSASFGTVPQGYIALAVWPHQHQGGSDIILGIPFFQERYTIANMAANRHYMGFAAMPQSEQKSPEFERIRAAVRQWQQQQLQLQQQQQQGASSNKGKGVDYGGDGRREHRRRRHGPA